MRTRLLTLTFLLANLAMGGTEDGCLLRPEAALKLPNLLTGSWKIGEVEYTPDRTANFEFTKDADPTTGEVILSVRALTNKHSGYWSTPVKLTGGHKYLTYFRALNNNGILLLWMNGDYGNNRKFDERIQVTSSTASYLIPLYLAPQYTTEMNSSWHTLYRTFTVPVEARELDLCYALGNFYGEGIVTFADITLVDVTEEKELPLQVDISIPNKKIKSVKVNLQRTEGDIVFEKHFPEGADSYRELVPGTSAEKAYRLEVTFADSSVVRVFGPAKDQTLGL